MVWVWDLVQTERHMWTKECPFVQGVLHAGHENQSDYRELGGIEQIRKQRKKNVRQECQRVMKNSTAAFS